MTDETDNKEVSDNGAGSDGLLAGERLAEARREQQISVLEVAKELHLDEPKVRALERNEFEVLGAPVFAKGHLRKYAQLVGVEIDDVLVDYYSLNRSVGMPPVVGKVRKPVREMSPGPWIVAIVVLIIAATAYWWFVEREPAPEPVSVVTPPPDVALENTRSEDLAAAVNDTVPQVSAQYPEANTEEPEAGPATAPPQEPPPLAEGDIRLGLEFTGECWTEITDAAGQRLFFDLGRDGRSVEVTGRAPLSVLFGNANNVSIEVNGASYAISPSDRRGETARLTIISP